MTRDVGRFSRAFRVSALVLMACTTLAVMAGPRGVGATPLGPATFEETIFASGVLTEGTSASAPETISVTLATGSASATTVASPNPLTQVTAETISDPVAVSAQLAYQFRLAANPGVEIPNGSEVTVFISFVGGITLDPGSDLEANIDGSLDFGSVSYGACVNPGGTDGCSSTSTSLDSGPVALQLLFQGNVSNTVGVALFASGVLTSGKFHAWIDPLPFIDPLSTLNGVVINGGPSMDGVPAIEVVMLELSSGVAVPEPGALALLALGLLALGGAARRRIAR